VEDQLIGDLALWRAAHGIRPAEPSPTGPPAKEPRQPDTSPGSSAAWRCRHRPPRPPQTARPTGSEPVNDRHTVSDSMTVLPATCPVRRDDRRPAATMRECALGTSLYRRRARHHQGYVGDRHAPRVGTSLTRR
jgi:hypothetical protein